NRAFQTIQTVTVTNAPWAPAGTTQLLTNTTTKTYLTNEVVGEFFIVPTNFCDVAIINAQLTNTTIVSNLLQVVIDPSGESFTQILLTYFTYHVFFFKHILCKSN